MTPQEIRKQCKQAQSLGLNSIILVVPGKWNYATSKRLFGRSGPRGRIYAEDKNGCVCDFRVNEVLAALDRLEEQNA